MSASLSNLDRVINICVTCPEQKVGDPFQILSSFSDPSIVIDHIISQLKKSKESTVKISLLKLFLQYFEAIGFKASDKVENFTSSLIISVATNVPASFPTKMFGKYFKYMQAIAPAIKKEDITSVSDSSLPFSTMTLSAISSIKKECAIPTLRLILSALKDPKLPDLYAAIYFFSKVSSTSDIYSVIRKDDSVQFFQTLLISLFSQRKAQRKAAARLSKSLFTFLNPADSARLSSKLLPQLIAQFREASLSLRTLVVSALSDILPDSEEGNQSLMNAIISPIASRFDDINDKYSKAVFELLVDRQKHCSLSGVIKLLLDSKETFPAGVAFACRLNIFSEDAEFAERCFPEHLSVTEATVASQGISIMGSASLIEKSMLPRIFRTLTLIFTNHTLLDDLMVIHKAFEAVDSLENYAAQSPSEFFDIFIGFLSQMKEDDVISQIGALTERVLRKVKTWSPTQIDAVTFSPLFLMIFNKFIEYSKDDKFRSQLLALLTVISAAGCGAPPNIQSGCSTLVELLDVLIPPNYVDSVRTDAIYLMQQKPVYSLIAVSLPGCGPFLPTLCRVAKSVGVQNSDFFRQFLKDASQRDLGCFLPHLIRFTEPVSESNGFLSSLIKTSKPISLNREVLDCVDYITRKLKVTSDVYSSLVSLCDSIFSAEKELPFPEAFSALTSLSLLNLDYIWPSTLLKHIFSTVDFAPSFHQFLRHCPNEKSLISISAKSFAQYCSRNPSFASSQASSPQSEPAVKPQATATKSRRKKKSSSPSTESPKVSSDSSSSSGKAFNLVFPSALFELSDTPETLEAVLLGTLASFTSDDPTQLLQLCYNAFSIFNETHDSIKFDSAPFISILCQFTLSTSSAIRTLSRNLLLGLFGAALPVDPESPIFLCTSALTPAEVVSSSKAILLSILPHFSSELFVDFAFYILIRRPFRFSHGVILQTLTSYQPLTLLSSQKNFLLRFFETGDSVEAESKTILLQSCKDLASADMSTFLRSMLSAPLTRFTTEVLVFLMKTLRAQLLDSYSELISNLTFPAGAKEQADFLSSGFFQAIKVILEADTTGEISQASFGSIVSLILIWLSLLFASSVNKNLSSTIASQLINCLELLFIRLGRSSHGPIEFNFSSYRTLYESLGTLSNALILVDFKLLIDFCKNCFTLLKSRLQQTVLVSSLCLSRLLHRVSSCDSTDSRKLIPQLKLAVAFSFSTCGDENCRVISSVMNDLFGPSLFDGLGNEDLTRMLVGTIRGISFSGEECRMESLSFLSKIVISAPKEIVIAQFDTIWRLLSMFCCQNAPVILKALSVLISYDRQLKHLQIEPITLPSIILNAFGVGELNTDGCKQLLCKACGCDDFDDVCGKLKDEIGDGDFENLFGQILERGKKYQNCPYIIDLLSIYSTKLRPDSEFIEKYMQFLMLILEESGHPCRSAASKQIAKIISPKGETNS